MRRSFNCGGGAGREDPVSNCPAGRFALYACLSGARRLDTSASGRGTVPTPGAVPTSRRMRDTGVAIGAADFDAGSRSSQPKTGLARPHRRELRSGLRRGRCRSYRLRNAVCEFFMKSARGRSCSALHDHSFALTRTWLRWATLRASRGLVWAGEASAPLFAS
jgi:hypothetical protein